MIANEHLFIGKARDHSYLKARGFDAATGARSGGIKDPMPVIIPVGTRLLRTYQEPDRLFGEWWFTAYEMAQVVEYFGREGSAFAEGRFQGKGILQATMAVRHDWGKFSPSHMGLAAAVQTTKLLTAFFGVGDVAPDATQQEVLKPVGIADCKGVRRGVRQIFLPETRTYTSCFTIFERDVPSDTDLIRLVRAGSLEPTPFEN